MRPRPGPGKAVDKRELASPGTCRAPVLDPSPRGPEPGAWLPASSGTELQQPLSRPTSSSPLHTLSGWGQCWYQQGSPRNREEVFSQVCGA